MPRHRPISACLLLAPIAWAPAHALDDLTEFSLEQLLASQVTSVAKKPQAEDDAAAAIFVITKEDIRNSSAESIPELLRLVPGVEVAQIDGNTTAITIRGFNGRLASKLLVLVDGRAVYQPTFSGVMWDQQLVPVEDIDRIEVIRGPGATLYGANAVNGVINVVTKHASDTLGGIASGRVSIAPASGEMTHREFLRMGYKINDNATIRAHATLQKIASLVDADDNAINDGSTAAQLGFRMDWEPNDRDAFTLQGDYQKLEFDVSFADAVLGAMTTFPASEAEESSSGQNLLARWTRSFSDTNQFSLQSYYDVIKRTEFGVEIEVCTFDIDFSHFFSWGDRYETVWGLGYRRITDDIEGGASTVFNDPQRKTELISSYIQQDIYFLDRDLRVSIGTKLEENEYTGAEVQPSLRALWEATDDLTLWAAVSHAVRTPSRVENSLEYEFGTVVPDPAAGIFLPTTVSLIATPDLTSEKMNAYEVGIRNSSQAKYHFDIAAYYNQYTDLITIQNAPPELIFAPIGPMGTPLPVGVQQDLITANAFEADIFGIEGLLEVDVTDRWDMSFSADLRNVDDLDVSPTDLTSSISQGQSPAYQLKWSSSSELTPDLTSNIAVRHVGPMDAIHIPEYTDLDINFIYQATPKFEIVLKGENLLDSARREFISLTPPAPEGGVERVVSLRGMIRF
jgi:iron complex outermembrane receptor protein